MSDMPPEQPAAPPPPPPSDFNYTGVGGRPVSGAILPVPGNAELAIFIIIEVILAIVWATSDHVDAGSWVAATTWITAAYIISRGIAKASRVLEQ